MKQKLFTNNIFYITVLTLVILSGLESFISLFKEFNYLSVLSLRLAILFVSMIALISLFFVNRYSLLIIKLFFVIICLIPFLYIVKELIVEGLIYGIWRDDLFSSGNIIIKPIVGLIILLLIPKFKKSDIQDSKLDLWGYLFNLLGIYMIIFSSIILLESQNDKLKVVLLVLSIIIGLFIVFLGVFIRKGQIKFRKGIIFTFLLILISSLIS